MVKFLTLILVQYLENSWICYLATIANCCEAVRSAIATAWLFVSLYAQSTDSERYPSVALRCCVIVRPRNHRLTALVKRICRWVYV